MSSQQEVALTPKRSLGKLQMVGSNEMINLNTLPESQAASIATISGPVTQQLLDMTAPINDGGSLYSGPP